ncbi:hypothetical protein BS50DRAFT_583521 [Corynespora cassiicola Philippines]|uniref:Uncharacterized protein n=1 Tax=Corynespora cassiicola Philippines TaxID=1448308 RepID=A0A2T2P2N8_CORCC|nr:hypothetical protein BS50DRAFT_583521 [Corynespora cassiicola Philippines]
MRLDERQHASSAPRQAHSSVPTPKRLDHEHWLRPTPPLIHTPNTLPSRITPHASDKTPASPISRSQRNIPICLSAQSQDATSAGPHDQKGPETCLLVARTHPPPTHHSPAHPRLSLAYPI